MKELTCFREKIIFTYLAENFPVFLNETERFITVFTKFL